MKKTILILSILISLMSFAHAEFEYTVTDLGRIFEPLPQAISINDSGQVAGSIRGVNNYWDLYCNKAFLYENGVMTEFGSTYYRGDSCAYDINESGQVLGVGDGDAFLYDDGVLDELGLPEVSSSHFRAINNSGQLVGEYGTESGYVAFIYDDGTVTELDAFGEFGAIAYDINDNGQVVGHSYIIDVELPGGWNLSAHAFLYEDEVMIDLGTLGGVNSIAYGINDSGQVVGYSNVAGGDEHAFLYDGDVMIDLTTLGGVESIAYAINDSGQVVGDSDGHAFLYDETEGMLDLNDLIASGSGWELNYAYDINSLGQIVGYGMIGEEEHAFLITPVPEPGTMLLFGLGGALLRRRESR